MAGNSLIRDKQHQTVADQFESAQVTAAHIVEMIAQGWEVVIPGSVSASPYNAFQQIHVNRSLNLAGEAVQFEH